MTQRDDKLTLISEKRLRELLESEAKLKAIEEKEAAQARKSVYSLLNPQRELQGIWVSPEPDQRCYKCGRTGYSLDEFLSPRTGICAKCHYAEK